MQLRFFSRNPTAFPAAILFSIVIASWFVQTTFPVQSFDFYYHLATGRWIVDHASIPFHDVFSSTAPGTRWVTHEWATQVALYLAYLLFGIDGLVLLKAAWLSAAAALLCLLGGKLKSPAWWTALLVSAAAPCIAFRAFLRPHVLSYGLMIILLAMLYGNFPAKKRSRTIALGVLFLIWGNCHSAFVFGIFILSVYECSSLLSDRSHFRQNARDSLTTVGVASGASMLNPNTWRSFMYPFKFIKHSELFGLVAELRPITTAEFRGAWFIPIFYVLMIAAALVFLIRIRHGSYRELVYLVVFGYMAINSIRNLPNAVLVVLPGLFLHGGALLGRITDRLSGKPVGLAAAAAAVALAPVFLIYTALSRGIPTERLGRRQVGLGIREMNYPLGSVDYLKKNSIHGHYFNTFAFGGYLLWALYPEPSVFIDGRLFVFYGPVMKAYRDVIDGGLALDELHRRYGVTHLVLAYPESSEGMSEGLYTSLLKSSDWRPVYWDDNSMVFLLQNSENAALVSRDAYRVIHPLHRTIEQIDVMLKSNPEAAYQEAVRAHRFYPRNTGAAVILGRYYQNHEHSYLKAVEYYDLVLNKHPDNKQIRIQKARALMDYGLFSEAEAEWRSAVDRKRFDGFIMMNIGICLHRQGKPDKAIEYYNLVDKSGYRSAELMNGFGIYHIEKGNIQQAMSYWRKGLELEPEHKQMQRNLFRAERMLERSMQEGDE